jgi:urease accessory protein
MSQSSRSAKACVGVACTVLLLLFPHASALAHHVTGGVVPSTFWQGLLSGFGHPVIGLDHFAFLLAVGLLASTTSKPSLLPLAFVVATLFGTAIHVATIDLPIAELFVACSVVVAGSLLFVRNPLSAVPLAGIFVLAGLFHGYAYGESIVGAEQSPLLAYLVGLAFMQYVIAIGVIGAMRSLGARFAHLRSRGLRVGGALVTCIGVFFIAAHVL